MNYPQARRKARTVFGPEGDARMVKVDKSLFRVTYAVGVVRDRSFLPLGAGASWDEAFANVKEVPAKAEPARAEVPAKATVEAGTGAQPPVQRVKL